jgi:hypothetical protein
VNVHRTAVAAATMLAAAGVLGADPSIDIQRQLNQREQQQMELRLRMQQQQSRALQPPQGAPAERQLRSREVDEQVRLREQIELENRERDARDLAPPTEAGRATRQTEDARR